MFVVLVSKRKVIEFAHLFMLCANEPIVITVTFKTSTKIYVYGNEWHVSSAQRCVPDPIHKSRLSSSLIGNTTVAQCEMLQNAGEALDASTRAGMQTVVLACSQQSSSGPTKARAAPELW